MSAQHTPGPWKTVSVYADFEVRTAEDALVAVVTPVRCESTENARLIAAAPDLLAACKAMLACCYDLERNDETLSAVKTTMYAIAKATGEMP